ncbi:Uncharacterised protein [Enterobacter cloacae]|nr:Uncharacterised protein [Enterobacter cloacae]
MTYYVNDAGRMVTLLACASAIDARIFASWANEHMRSDQVCVEMQRHALIEEGDDLLSYFGFTIDSLVDRLFVLLPARSQIKANIALIKCLLKEPTLSKQQCCIKQNKSPSHYSRLSNSLSLHAKMVGELTGGRNPIRLLRAIRSDL